MPSITSMMEATDMKSPSRCARHERRVLVVGLRKAGQTCDEIAAQTGLSRTGVFDIRKRHEAAGAKALLDAPSGRKSGDCRLLDAPHEAIVRKLIAHTTSDQLKMPMALPSFDVVQSVFDAEGLSSVNGSSVVVPTTMSGVVSCNKLPP